MNALQEELFSHQDETYRQFHTKLVPTVAPERIIGVRVPILRAMAKKMYTQGCDDFLNSLPHTYYEENQLHGLIITLQKDFARCIALIDAFLPYIDNWATCDSMSPRVFKKHHQQLLPHAMRYLASGHTYTVRYGILTLMNHFLDEDFDASYLDCVAALRHEDYYVQMMIAWYFATALAKQYDAAIIYLEQQRLPVWIHNKAIQKACESRRITPETKAYLKTLKVKTR